MCQQTPPKGLARSTQPAMGSGLDPLLPRLSCRCLPVCCQLAREAAGPPWGHPPCTAARHPLSTGGSWEVPRCFTLSCSLKGGRKWRCGVEIGIWRSVLCWEAGAGGSSVRGVSVPLCRGFTMYAAPRCHRSGDLRNALSQVCYVKHIFFWLTRCNWRPGKIPKVWGIAEEMFYS